MTLGYSVKMSNELASQQHVLRNMIMTFRVSELQMLLGFAGRNKNGKKHELQARALDLVNIRSTPMQAKIRELYKSSQQSQQAADAAMMNQGSGQPPIGYPGNYYAMMAAAANPYANTRDAAAALALQGRNPYTTGNAAGYPVAVTAPPGSIYGTPYSLQQQQQQQQAAAAAAMALAAARTTMPVHPDLRMVKLPFYDVHAELLRPSTLPSQGNSRFHEAQFQFFLTPQQATDVASKRDISVGPQVQYIYQIQLRFCQLSLEPGREMADEFPPSICVHVNGKMAQLPNPIPTNKPGVEPKRPPRSVDITHLAKLSPILPNNVNIKWASGSAPGWVVGIWLVMKLTSNDLLERLKKKGTRNPEFTRGLIVEKLNDDDEVATTSLKATVLCPLGKMRMQVPCRPSTCSHLQCFDASLFLQMNEKRQTWNCPVCESKALYETLLIDGYFQEVLDSPQLPKEENDILLESDGSWKPVPKDDEKTKPPSSLPPAAEAASAAVTNGGGESAADNKEDVECIDLSDDENSLPPLPSGPMPSGPMPSQPPPPLMGEPHPPPLPPPPAYQPVMNPPMPLEIECIDLD